MRDGRAARHRPPGFRFAHSGYGFAQEKGGSVAAPAGRIVAPATGQPLVAFHWVSMPLFLTTPSSVLPLSLPEYCALPAVKLISLPSILPAVMVTVAVEDLTEPDNIWWRC